MSASFFAHSSAIVEAPDLRVEHKGYEQRLAFDLPADVDVTVTLITEVPNPWPYIILHEVLPSGLRVPDWDLFTPLWSAESPLNLVQPPSPPSEPAGSS